MATVNRSVLTNIGVFTADNNIRRNVASFSTNYVTASGGTTAIYQTIPAGGVYTFTPSVSAVIIVDVSGPVFADLTFPDITIGDTSRVSTISRLVVNRLLHIDDSVSSVVFTNPQPYDVRLSLIQG